MQSQLTVALRSLLIADISSGTPFPFQARDNPRIPSNTARDPEDFSWIKTWAAVGDSFAAGIGAGDVLNGPNDVKCSQYSGASSELINIALGPGTRNYQFLACSGDTSLQVSKQVKALEFHQDLVIVSAGGNDVGFDDVLKKCVYLPYPESACDGAFTNTQALINHGLERSIDNLLDDLDRIMNVNGIVVYTKYAKFFNADTDACDDKSWTYLDPTGSSGLKMTKARRKRMNDMVDSANCKIQNTIDSFNGRYLFAKMKLVTAEWENFVGATFGHFCEDGASEDPDNNIGLAFQRQDSTPQFVPPGKDKLDAVQVRREFLSGEAQSDSARLESRAPDAIARVFHPSIYGQSVIATMAMSAFISARASQILGTSSPISNCSHKVTPQGLPASDAKDTLGKTIEPACGKCSDMQIDPSDIGAAIQDYCSNNGKPFFRGDKTINNAIGSLSDHIMTMGTSLKDQAGSFYQDANSCKYVATMTAPLTIAKITMLIKPVVRTFDEKINTGDCTFALQVIDKKCNPPGKIQGYCPGTYTYKCTSWGIGADP